MPTAEHAAAISVRSRGNQRGHSGGALGKRWGLEAEMLVEHTPGGMMQMPINVMIVDATGEAVRVLITPEGATFLT
jgi:acetone carboxylase gamma subunit